MQKSDVQPYIDIASNYGFANYMFATNQGPSLPAHHFLLSGTSAPTAPGEDDSLYFVADNGGFGGGAYPVNCPGPPNNFPPLVDYTSDEISLLYRSCYDHPTLTDLLDPPEISWRYYATDPGGIWAAPSAISHMCYDQNHEGQSCDNQEYLQNMRFESRSNPVPILSDILSCQLAQVSWVTPDERWSDHQGGGGNLGLGPAYVANIVDAIGSNPTHCAESYWQDTAIFILWDDWGGYYDHVPPPIIMRKGDGHNDCENPGPFGCGYIYGFRVPLLVVSAYTPSGYVSGACTPLNCPNANFPYVHDFGSILRFIESNFQLGRIAPPGFAYADAVAPDSIQGHVPLSDFFTLTTPRNFVSIDPGNGVGMSFFTQYFTLYPSQAPAGPDPDDTD